MTDVTEKVLGPRALNRALLEFAAPDADANQVRVAGTGGLRSTSKGS